jgi:TonB family protein
MNPKEFVTKPNTEVNVSLDPSVSDLSEVVVVGYGVNKKEASGEEYSGNHTHSEPIMGKSNFDKYIRNNLHRPDSVTSGQRVVVVVSLLIQTDGSIDSIRIVRSPGKAFSDEAMRVIKSGPPWKPAEDNGKPVEDEVRLRIVFR